jgi:Uma2 family endonuclease
MALAPQAPASTLAPLVLPPGQQPTPEQFALVCEANPEAVLELAADSQLITMTPTGGETGARCPCSCSIAPQAFSGPRGAEALRRKMALYQADGAQLGWLLFPEQRAVEIWAS